VEQVSIQLSQENADRRFRSDAGRQCIPRSSGRFRESPVSECGTFRRRYQRRDGVSRPRVSSNVATRGATDELSQVCWFSLMQTVVHQHTQPEIDSFRGTFSQCNWRSSHVTLSYLLAEQTSLAAALRTDCRRRSCVDDAPAVTESQ